MVCKTDCHRFGVAPSKFQTRLRAMRQSGEEGQVTILDLQNFHFIPYMEYLEGVTCTNTL